MTIAPEIPSRRPTNPVHDCVALCCLLCAGVRLQRYEDKCAVRRIAAKAEAGDGEGAFDLRMLLHDVLYLLSNPLGVVERCAPRRLCRDNEISLVFVRNESFRYSLKNQ